jgi:acylphosphatase
MTKVRFYIKNKVQEVGYRPFVIQRILESDFEGTAMNLPDGSVEVLLEGEEEKIIEFIDKLREDKPKLTEKPVLSEIEFDEALTVPKAMRSSQSLLLDQLGKGIIYIARMDENIKEMRKEIRDGLENLPERIAKALRESK